MFGLETRWIAFSTWWRWCWCIIGGGGFILKWFFIIKLWWHWNYTALWTLSFIFSDINELLWESEMSNKNETFDKKSVIRIGCSGLITTWIGTRDTNIKVVNMACSKWGKSQRHIVYLWVLSYAHINRRSFYRKSGALTTPNTATDYPHFSYQLWWIASRIENVFCSWFRWRSHNTYGRRLNGLVLRFSERLLQRDLKSIVYLKIRNEIRIKMISIYDVFRIVSMLIHCQMVSPPTESGSRRSRGIKFRALAK